MFCQNCGNELREGAAFCQNCGQPIRETANVRSERPNAPAYIPPQQTQTGYFTPGQGQSGAVYPEAASTQKPKKKGRGCLIAAIIVLTIVIAVPLLGGLGLTWFLNRYDAQKDASPIRAVEVTFPASTGAQAVVEQQAAVAVEAYLVARAYTDKLENYDLDSFDPDEYAALLDRTVAAWEAADALAAGLEGNAELLVALEDEGITGSAGTVEYRELASGRALQNPLFTTAYAADGEEKTAKEWAEEIQQMYDAYPPGKAIQGLAHAMKTDTAHAAVIHQQAQAILKGEADAEAGYYNAAYKTAVETKAAATVAGAAVAVVATGGTAGAVAHAFAVGGTVCSGAQAILDVGTAYTIHATDGEGDEYTAAFERTSNQFAPVAGIFGLLNAGVNAYNMYQGVDVYDNAVQAGIWAANELLSHIQGDGTMLGGTFTQNSDGTVSFTMIETMLGGDMSHEDAVALALQSMGIDTATIEEARAIAAGEAAAPTEPDGLGEAADAFIEQWDIFTDPDEPFDAAGFNDYMSERFEGAAEEQRLAAGDRPVSAAVPQLNPATDWFEEDDPDEPAATAVPMPETTPEPVSKPEIPELVGGYEEGVSGTYWMVCDGIEGERHFESYAYVTLYDSGEMEILCNGEHDLLEGTYDPRTHTFVGTENSDHDWLSATIFDGHMTTITFRPDSSPVTASGMVDASNVQLFDDVIDMSVYITMEKTD